MKNPRSAWITYTVLRLLFFAVPFALVYMLGLSLRFSLMLSAVVATVFAALISVSLSLLLLSKPREVASESIYEWRHRDRTADDIAEDEAIAAAEGVGRAGDTEPVDRSEPLEEVEPSEPVESVEHPEQAASNADEAQPREREKDPTQH
ncbi:DUF4229 domain-containing protein [Leucobacter celer]|uniref:DUF4229 domain-containing protein n=1 Tax=Leucobacter celer TaxID=668625 RepID=UPI0006A7C326|nr:DUF4229 domain-containing protein [Leucobacter celer]